MRSQVVLCSVKSKDEAQTIAKALVQEHLAACVNIIPKIESFYIYEDALCHDEELLLVIKSSDEKFELLKQHIEALHSYEVPEIIALSIDQGNSAYLEWLGNALK